MYFIANSRKDNGEALKKHILKDILPHGFDARIEEIQEKHNEQTSQLQQVITDRDNQIQAIQYENVVLQAQRDVYQTQLQRCEDTIICLRDLDLDHARDPGKDNIIIIVRKDTTSTNCKYHDRPYYIARIQRRKRYVKLRWFDQQFPDHEVIVEIDSPNSIHAFNRFEEEGHEQSKDKTTLGY